MAFESYSTVGISIVTQVTVPRAGCTNLHLCCVCVFLYKNIIIYKVELKKKEAENTKRTLFSE